MTEYTGRNNFVICFMMLWQKVSTGINQWKT